MADPNKVASVKCQPKQGKVKRQVKQVLASPFEVKWPTISPAQTQQLDAALALCATGLQRGVCPKPPWSELRDIEKSKLKEARKQFRLDHINGLPSDEKEAFLKQEASSGEKMSHVILGYNSVMKKLEKEDVEVVAILLNKSVIPEVLAESFLPVCRIKRIPLIHLDNLEGFFPKSIVIGFKKSVKSTDCCFYPLYKNIIEVVNGNNVENCDVDMDHVEEDLQNSDITKEHLQHQPKSPVSKVKNKFKRPPPPFVDVGKYHLKRCRTDMRAFIPGQGYNTLAMVDDSEMIIDDLASYGLREYKGNYRNANGDSSSDGVTTADGDGDDDDGSTTKSSALSSASSSMMFLLDLDGDCSARKIPSKICEQVGNQNGNKNESCETTLNAEKVYIPAKILRIGSNMKKK